MTSSPKHPKNALRPNNYGQNYITTNRFYVEIQKELKASFAECTGLDIQIDKEVFSEGGVNDQQRVLLKQIKFSEITLKRGMSDDLTFWEWLNQVISNSQADYQKSKQDTRRNISILVFNQAGETMQAWTLYGAVPVGWKTPAFQADGNAVAIEELTLAFEGVKVEAKGSSQFSNPVTRDSKTGYFGGS